ncbi:hypothetical protein D3C87_301950 [compost metagenome]
MHPAPIIAWLRTGKRGPRSAARSMLFALRLLAITVPSGWIVLLGGAERVQGLCALLEFDLATLFTEPLTVHHVRLCTAITWCISGVVIGVIGLR